MPFMFFLFTNFEFILCLFPFAVWVLSSGFICHNGDLGLTLISHARNIKGKQLRLSFHIIDYLILFLAINIKGLIVCLRYHQQNIKGIGQPQQKGAFDITRRHNNLWIWGEDYANIDSEEQVSSVGMLIWAQPNRVSPDPANPFVTLTLIFWPGFKQGWP